MSQELNLPPKNGLQIPGSANPTWRDLEEILARQVEEIKVQRVKDRQAAVDCKCAWNELQLVFNTSLAGGAALLQKIDSYIYGTPHKLKDLQSGPLQRLNLWKLGEMPSSSRF
jgi:hypothetical protein